MAWKNLREDLEEEFSALEGCVGNEVLEFSVGGAFRLTLGDGLTFKRRSEAKYADRPKLKDDPLERRRARDRRYNATRRARTPEERAHHAAKSRAAYAASPKAKEAARRRQARKRAKAKAAKLRALLPQRGA